MFKFIGKDVFEVMKRIDKIINCYSFWFSKDIYTILAELNLFLQDSCKEYDMKAINREQLKRIGVKAYDTIESYRIRLISFYENEYRLDSVLNTLSRVNQSH